MSCPSPLAGEGSHCAHWLPARPCTGCFHGTRIDPLRLMRTRRCGEVTQGPEWRAILAFSPGDKKCTQLPPGEAHAQQGQAAGSSMWAREEGRLPWWEQPACDCGLGQVEMDGEGMLWTKAGGSHLGDGGNGGRVRKKRAQRREK